MTIKTCFSRRQSLVAGMGLAALAMVSPAGVFAQSTPLPNELTKTLPALQLSGRARLRVLGFRVYDAQLWTGPGFAKNNPTDGNFVLDLTYLRDLKGGAIAERSIAEMRRQGELPEEQASKWLAFMQKTFPDVSEGTRLLAVNQPGKPTLFYAQGKLIGQISDEAFDRRFFGIWLGKDTSEPAMRDALLAGSP